MVNSDDNIKFSLKEKILKLLIENKEKAWTIREISQNTGVDYKNVFEAIGSLGKVVSKEKIGGSNIIKLRFEPRQEIFNVEEKRTKIFLDKNKDIGLIQKDVEAVNYPFFIVLAFGSYIKLSKSKSSDIDICVIFDNEVKKKELISKLNLLPLKLEVHEFNVGEFDSMLEVKKDNIAKEIVKNNVILYGAENYYNLVSKWMKKD